MNALELADMLAKSSIRKVSQGEVVVDMFEIADTLRQQQAEIEALKRIEKPEEIPFELIVEVTEKGASIDFTPFFKPELHGKYRIRLEKIK